MLTQKVQSNMRLPEMPLLYPQLRMQLGCPTTYLQLAVFSGSPTFHCYFDGPDTAPCINVAFVCGGPSDEGFIDFTLKVGTFKVERFPCQT